MSCYNSSSVIVPAVEALTKQEVPPNIKFEVILVDNNCSDNTVHLAEKTWDNVNYPLRIIKESEPGLIYARKTGVVNAKYDILLFVDDDNILATNWVKILFELYSSMPHVGSIGGYNKAMLIGDKPEWFDRFQFVYACGARDVETNENPKKTFGAGLSFRTDTIKSILLSPPYPFLVGHTKNVLNRGEDTEMVLRCILMGWDFYYEPLLKLSHLILPDRLTWKYVCRARIGDGITHIIVRIYKDLLNGKKPIMFSRAMCEVLIMWLKYIFQTNWRLIFIKKEGSKISFLYYSYLGMSLGLLHYRKTYRGIRKVIVDKFSIIQKHLE